MLPGISAGPSLMVFPTGRLLVEQAEATRVVLKLHPRLAPIKAAVLPLVKKDGLPEIAEKIVHDLKFDFNCQYDEKDSIGKRYRRQDAIGTPFCVTVDNQTLEELAEIQGQARLAIAAWVGHTRLIDNILLEVS